MVVVFDEIMYLTVFDSKQAIGTLSSYPLVIPEQQGVGAEEGLSCKGECIWHRPKWRVKVGQRAWERLRKALSARLRNLDLTGLAAGSH